MPTYDPRCTCEYFEDAIGPRVLIDPDCPVGLDVGDHPATPPENFRSQISTLEEKLGELEARVAYLEKKARTTVWVRTS